MRLSLLNHNFCIILFIFNFLSFTSNIALAMPSSPAPTNEEEGASLTPLSISRSFSIEDASFDDEIFAREMRQMARNRADFHPLSPIYTTAQTNPWILAIQDKGLQVVLQEALRSPRASFPIVEQIVRAAFQLPPWEIGDYPSTFPTAADFLLTLMRIVDQPLRRNKIKKIRRLIEEQKPKRKRPLLPLELKQDKTLDVLQKEQRPLKNTYSKSKYDKKYRFNPHKQKHRFIKFKGR